MRATLLGFTVPDETFAEILSTDPVMPTQTHKFAWALVRALRDNDVRIDLVSVVPVSTYPSGSRLFWRTSTFEEGGVTGVLLPFVNVIVLKHITRFLSCVALAVRRIRNHRSEWVLVHGVHSPFLWFALFARARTAVRVAAVLSDPPGVVRASDSRLSRVLKRLDVHVTRWALRRFDAVIALSAPLAEDFAPGVPRLVMEGLVAMSEVQAPGPSDFPPRAVYAGGLLAEYGVLTLAHAVLDSDLEVTLECYGAGDASEELRALAARDSRIVCLGLVTPDELQARYRGAAVLVQPRAPEHDFVRYTFPSKLIEYMSTGIPVISTRLPSIPDDYAPHVIWAPDATARGLESAIRERLEMPAEQAERFGRDAATFIRGTRSPTRQGARVAEFLRGLGSAGGIGQRA